MENENISERITGFGKTHSMELIVFPLFILIIIGIISNNMIASNVQTTPTFQISSYSSGAVTPIGNNGCDSSKQNCNFTAVSAFTFLNPNSPFTYLLYGDLSGFISLFSNGNPQSNSLNALSLCSDYQAGISLTFLHCTSSSWAIAGPPIQPYPLVSCNFPTALGTGFNASASSAPITTNSGQANVTLWTITGCAPANRINSTPLNQSASLLIQADYNGANNSITLTKYKAGIVDIANNGGAISFISFFLGVILILLSFGFGFLVEAFGGNGIELFANDQGTRLAQSLGIGLTVWSFVYSEFSSWLTTFSFSLGTIIFTMLTACFFMGLYWRMFSLD